MLGFYSLGSSPGDRDRVSPCYQAFTEFYNYKSSMLRSGSHTPQSKLVLDPEVEPFKKAASLAQFQRAPPCQSGWNAGSGPGVQEAPGPPLPLHRFLRSCSRASNPSEGMLGRVREPRLPQRARAATCGCVPAELGATGGRRAGQLSKTRQLPRLHSPRTDRCGPRCPGRSAPSSACPC